MPPRKAKAKEQQKERKLTLKRVAFCQAYAETGNASEAYRRAYPSSLKWKPHAVHVAGSELLAVPEVKVRIEELRAAHMKRHEITVDKIIRELALIGFSNMLDYVQPQEDGTAYVDLSKLTREQAAAISEVVVETYTEGQGEGARDVKRVRFKLSDKRGALVDLGKHLGMFPAQVSGKIEHNHKHDHEHRTVSESAEWLTGLLGSGSHRPLKESLPH